MKIQKLIGKIEEKKQGKDIDFYIVETTYPEGTGQTLITLDQEDIEYLYTKYNQSPEGIELRNELRTVLKELKEIKNSYNFKKEKKNLPLSGKKMKDN